MPASLWEYADNWFTQASTHWFLFLLICILLLCVAGMLGRSVGVPSLFRDRDRDPKPWVTKSYAAWTGFGATMLIAQVWHVVMLYHTWETRPSGVRWWAPVNPFLDPGNIGPYLTSLAANSGPFLILLLLCAAFPWHSRNSPPRKWANVFADVSRYSLGILLAVAVTFFQIYLVCHQLWPVLLLILIALPLIFRSPKQWYIIALGCLVLLAAGGAWYLLENARSEFTFDPARIIPVMLFSAWAVTYLIRIRSRPRSLFFGMLSLAMAVCYAIDRETAEWFIKPPLDQCAKLHQAFWVVVGALSFVLASLSWWQELLPPMCVKLLFTWMTVFYTIILFTQQEWQVPVAAFIVIGFVLGNFEQFKYRFPNLNGYDEPVAPIAPAVHPILNPPLLDDDEVLRNWHRSIGIEKPRLVLIGVSGGAYRSAFWVSTVLERIEQVFQEKKNTHFHKHVRLITGASGGMVGAAYYAALLNQQKPDPLGITAAMTFDTGLDSFGGITKQLLQYDIPMSFVPDAYQKQDRGVTVEDCWKTLDQPFPFLAGNERLGKVPSVVFSPMLVETGQRLLISNLDLEVNFLTDEARRGIGPQVPSVLPFFKVFPDSRETFKIKTAVRMNASFPYLSPAVSLPTKPARRVVDAGYYDNFGVNLAMLWAWKNREWIVKNTSGLAFVQIQAFTSRTAVSTETPPKPTTFTKIGDRFQTSFQWLLSPPQAAVESLDSGMVYRNDEQFSLTRDLYRELDPNFPIETFIFENPTDFAMNWFLTSADIDDMVNLFAQHDQHGTPHADNIKARDDRFRRHTVELIKKARLSVDAELKSLLRWWK